MILPRFQPVNSAANLKERVRRLFKVPARRKENVLQYSLDLLPEPRGEHDIIPPSSSVSEFLDFVTDAVPDGDVYLFGGVLRDLALLGQKGFASDVDLVVEGNWSHLISYLHTLKARKNKFGGYRLQVGRWPVDIWQARETWAIKEGLVCYRGVASLIDTTVLNWDAVLMNWRTEEIIHRESYFDELRERVLDVVLVENPNPLGAAIRAFRHFALKDARKITTAATKYLANCAKLYGIEEIQAAEMRSYGNTFIEPRVLKFFEAIDISRDDSIRHQFSIARDIVEPGLVPVVWSKKSSSTVLT